MRPEDLQWVAKQLKLNPGQVKRLERAASQQDVNVEVRLLPGHSLRQAQAPGDEKRLPFMDRMLEDLGPELRGSLAEIEPQVLAWVDASEENAKLFATDPLAALRQAVPRFDQAKLAALNRLRDRNSRPQPGTRVNLRNVKIVRNPNR